MRKNESYIDLFKRIFSDLEINDNHCWISKQKPNLPHGYLNIKIKGKRIYKHVLFYRLFFGEYPNNFDHHHICKNRICCNPFHLIPMVKRFHRQMEKTENNGNLRLCSKGHEAVVGQRCRLCDREVDRNRYFSRRSNPKYLEYMKNYQITYYQKLKESKDPQEKLF